VSETPDMTMVEARSQGEKLKESIREFPEILLNGG